MNQLIKILNEDSFIKFNNWLDNEDGHVNPVFMGEFNHPIAGNITSFCKLYNPNGKGLFNEILGFLWGYSVGIQQPKHAFIAILPKKILPELSKVKAKNEWINNSEQENLFIFCTSRLDGKSAAIHFNQLTNQSKTFAGEALVNDISQWKQYPSAIALDENIAHADRHLNNLIRLGKNNYALIDNGRLVDSGSENWTVDMLQHQKLFDNKLLSIVMDFRNCDNPSDLHIQKNAILQAEKHEELIKPVELELSFWVNSLLDEPEKVEFQKFLQLRTKETPWLLKQRFQIPI